MVSRMVKESESTSHKIKRALSKIIIKAKRVLKKERRT